MEDQICKAILFTFDAAGRKNSGPAVKKKRFATAILHHSFRSGIINILRFLALAQGTSFCRPFIIRISFAKG